MRPGRPDLSEKANEELADIANSTAYTIDVRADARSMLLTRGLAAEDFLRPIPPPCHSRVARHQLRETRKPVLYLRPFSVDNMTSRTGSRGQTRAESAFLEPLEKLGPVIAIGRPGESRPPAGGATRIYAEIADIDKDWQRLFHKLLGKSAYVVLFAGVTGNVTWEIDQVFRREPFIPTILLLPFFESSSRNKKNREAMGEFRSAFGNSTGIFLRNVDFCPVIYFPERGKAIPFGKREGFVSLGYLNPYLPAIVSLLHSIDPALAEPYRSTTHWLWIGLAMASVINAAIFMIKC
jgi:hypothetical protein